MKKLKIIIMAALMALLSVGGVATVCATTNDINSTDFDPTPGANARTTIEPRNNEQGTFSVAQVGNDNTEIGFGSNLLLAGNFVDSNKMSHSSFVNGLLFSAGNQLGLETSSEYAFLAGNIINFTGEVEKDLFIAGNNIDIANAAKIGRDVFATGNIVKVNTDLPGNLSIAAARVVINGINIKGDLNLNVDNLIIEGKANVEGKLIINSDAEIDGLSNLTYKEVEKYEVVQYEATATEILIGKIISIASLFIAFAIVMAMFPAVKGRVAKELDMTQFGKDILIGAVVLVFVPIIIFFLVISFVGAPAGLLLLGVYLASLYLAQGYAGLWLGKLIVEKLTHGKINDFVEMLLGITLLTLLIMIPGVGSFVWLLAELLGLGLFMQSIKPNRQKKQLKADATDEEVVEKKVIKEKVVTKSKKNNNSDKSEQDVEEEE